MNTTLTLTDLAGVIALLIWGARSEAGQRALGCCRLSDTQGGAANCCRVGSSRIR